MQRPCSDPDALAPFIDINKCPIDVATKSREYLAMEILKERGINSNPFRHFPRVLFVGESSLGSS